MLLLAGGTSRVASAQTPTVEQLHELLIQQQRELEAAQEEIRQLRRELRSLGEATGSVPTPAEAESGADAGTLPTASPSDVGAAPPSEEITTVPPSEPSAIYTEPATVPAESAPVPTPAVVASGTGHKPWPAHSPGNLELGSYGIINYFNYDWETDDEKRDDVDVERIALSGEYQLTRTFSVELELEIEHLGTGSTLEFDKFEEFGEFETEIERGGEVELEEVVLAWERWRLFNVRFGHYPLPIGSLADHHHPSEYFTTTRHASEATIIPTLWDETGIEAYGFFDRLPFGDLGYRVGVATALDSTGFSSANWIRRGQQKRFEFVNAEDLAGYGQITYLPPVRGLRTAASIYYGDSADNRPKPDLDVPAHVTVWSVDGRYERGPVILRGAYIGGHLQNSDAVTEANRQLSNNLNVKRTPVAADAYAAWVELGIDGSRLVRYWPRRLIPFVRYDSYDSMDDVEGIVIDNPRWERETWTGGLNYFPIRNLVLKAQYGHRELAIPVDDVEDTWSLGFGYEFELDLDLRTDKD